MKIIDKSVPTISTGQVSNLATYLGIAKFFGQEAVAFINQKIEEATHGADEIVITEETQVLRMFAEITSESRTSKLKEAVVSSRKDLCMSCGKEHAWKLWGAVCDCGNSKTVHLVSCDGCNQTLGQLTDDDYCAPEKIYCTDCIAVACTKGGLNK